MNAQAAAPRIGDNSGAVPLPEILAEETIVLKQRAEDLIAAAGRAHVSDDETAGKAAALAKMIREHAKMIDDARTARKEPFLIGGRQVDAHFTALKAPLDGAQRAVVGLIDTYRRDQEAKVAAERRRLEEEARKQRDAAEAAERARRDAEARAAREAEDARQRILAAEAAAKASGDQADTERLAKERAEAEAAAQKARADALAREADIRIAQDAAAELDRRGAETRVSAIDSGLGAKASGRKVYMVEITDLTAALRHARKVDDAAIKTAVQAVYERQVKAGVRELPGATVHESTQTIIR